MTFREALSLALGSQSPDGADSLVGFYRESWAAMPLLRPAGETLYLSPAFSRDLPLVKAYNRRWLMSEPASPLRQNSRFFFMLEYAGNQFINKGFAKNGLDPEPCCNNDWAFKRFTPAEIELK